MKIRSVGVETDGRNEVNSRFSKFANAPKKEQVYLEYSKLEATNTVR